MKWRTKTCGGLVTSIKMSGHWQSDAKRKKCAVGQPSNIFITQKLRFYFHITIDELSQVEKKKPQIEIDNKNQLTNNEDDDFK